MIPVDLITEIKRRRCVLFAGAGLSCTAGLPNWRVLLENLIDKANDLRLFERTKIQPNAVREELVRGNFGLVADELRECCGPALLGMLQRCLVSNRPSKTQLIVPHIPFHSVYTTNYDTLLESAYVLENGYSPSFCTYDNSAALGLYAHEDKFCIVKAHGTIDQANLIFGPSDYCKLIPTAAAYKGHISGVLTTKHVLFVGYGVNDPDLQLFLSEVRAKYEGHQATHYAVLGSDTSELMQRHFRRNYGIEVIPWPGTTQGMPDLYEFMSELRRRTDQGQSDSAHKRPAASRSLEDLVANVIEWLRSVHYVLKGTDLTHRTGDVRLERVDGEETRQVLVRCISGPVQAADILSVTSLRGLSQAWVVTDEGGHSLLLNHPSTVPVLTFPKFLKELIWADRFDIVKRNATKWNIPQWYVPLQCCSVDAHGERRGLGDLESYAEGWLRAEHGHSQLAILGDFGSGKTWFCYHFIEKLVSRYLEDPEACRLPLLISLRLVTGPITAARLINDALHEDYDLPFSESAFEMVQKLNEQGKILLIIDGFDEMARRVPDRTVENNYHEVSKLVKELSKVVLTSRILPLWRTEQGRRLLLQTPGSQIVHIEPFTDNQLSDAISKRVHNSSAPGLILKPKLAEMARKPVMMDLIVTAVEKVDQDKIKNRAHVYLYATKARLQDSANQEGRDSIADEIRCLCELAWEMLKSANLRLPLQKIEAIIGRPYGSRPGEQHDSRMLDVKSPIRMLLQSDSAGNCEFVHKSVAEYFAALKYVAAIRLCSREFLSVYGATTQEFCNTLRAKDLDLPPNASALAADIVSKEADDLQALCQIAWEETGLVGWNAQNILPYLKHSHGDDLVALLLKQIVQTKSEPSYRMRSGVAWAFGELGQERDDVKNILRQTVHSMVRSDTRSTSAAWEAAFALEKLHEFDPEDEPGTGPVRLLMHRLTALPEPYTPQYALENLTRCYSSKEPKDAIVNHCDVIVLAFHRDRLNASDLETLFEHVFGRIDVSRDRVDRRAYFAVWLCGYLKIEKSVDTVIRSTAHDHSSVRNCAAEALGKIGTRTAAVREALEEMLQDTYYRTRYHAAWSIGELHLTESAKRLAEIARVEEVPDVQHKMEAVAEKLLH